MDTLARRPTDSVLKARFWFTNLWKMDEMVNDMGGDCNATNSAAAGSTNLVPIQMYPNRQ